MSGEAASELIDPAFLFRFEFDLRRNDLSWSARGGLDLPEDCRLPWPQSMNRPTGDTPPDIRLGWNDDGIGVTASVRGKRSAAWCRDSRPEDSDGVNLWIDTRASAGVHRASKYCHRFAVLPAGGGDDRQQPCVVWLPIHRARANPKIVDATKIRVHAVERHDGYDLSAFFPADQLTGYDPANQPRISIHVVLKDRELGDRPLTIGPPYPVDEDPSLWTAARLV